MKKILLVVVAMLCIATVSAQSKFESSVKQAAQTVASQKWAVGLRVGAGIQADAECFYAGDKYFEGRFGLFLATSNYAVAPLADFTVLHNWNCFNWNWTPKVATWYLDAGCGINVGGKAHLAYTGAAGSIKFGMKFKKVPIRLAVDYTPVIGVQIDYGKDYYGNNYSDAYFYGAGLTNFGVSATYCF